MGEGQFWIMTHKGRAGDVLDGGALPLEGAPNAPIRQYWSITLYDRETHAFILNMPYTSRSSQTPRAAEERRRLGRSLLRELGAHQSNPPV